MILPGKKNVTYKRLKKRDWLGGWGWGVEGTTTYLLNYRKYKIKLTQWNIISQVFQKKTIKKKKVVVKLNGKKKYLNSTFHVSFNYENVIQFTLFIFTFSYLFLLIYFFILFFAYMK